MLFIFGRCLATSKGRNSTNPSRWSVVKVRAREEAWRKMAWGVAQTRLGGCPSACMMNNGTPRGRSLTTDRRVASRISASWKFVCASAACNITLRPRSSLHTPCAFQNGHQSHPFKDPPCWCLCHLVSYFTVFVTEPCVQNSAKFHVKMQTMLVP